jgi:hypothetical protein
MIGVTKSLLAGTNAHNLAVLLLYDLLNKCFVFNIGRTLLVPPCLNHLCFPSIQIQTQNDFDVFGTQISTLLYVPLSSFPSVSSSRC